jgi:hypothetical protein
MMGRWIEGAVAASAPGVAAVAHDAVAVPVSLAVVWAVAWPLVYIYRTTVFGVLGWRAIDRTDGQNRVAEVMSAITGVPVPPSQDEPAPEEHGPERAHAPGQLRRFARRLRRRRSARR